MLKHEVVVRLDPSEEHLVSLSRSLARSLARARALSLSLCIHVSKP
jgi:hypothetical protein